MRRALALRMGYPLGVLGRLMTYVEFLDWCRHFSEHPFDDEAVVDLPVAKLQAAIHNTTVTRAEQVLSPADFLPKRRADSAAADPDEPVNFDAAVLALR